VDRFGNCVLNLPCEALAKTAPGAFGFTLAVPSRRPLMSATTYDDIAPGSVGILKGSQGYWELAVNRGSAAAWLGLAPGDAVVIEF